MHPVGTSTDRATIDLDLAPGTVIESGSHDLSCASLGIDGMREGIASDGTGSVEAIALPIKVLLATPELQALGFCSECHLYPDLYLAVGFHLN